MLLVSPGLINTGSFPAPSSTYYQDNDVSARVVSNPSNFLIPNSLGDLTKRENRFAHYDVFPYNLNAPAPVNIGGVTPPSPPYPMNSAYLVPFHTSSPRYSDDVLLTNVLSFDVQVYDPNAPLRTNGGMIVSPTDPGYAAGTNSGAFGEYVDLGSSLYTGAGGAPAPLFNSAARQTVTTVAPPIDLAPRLPGTMTTSSDPPTGGTVAGAT